MTLAELKTLIQNFTENNSSNRMYEGQEDLNEMAKIGICKLFIAFS